MTIRPVTSEGYDPEQTGLVKEVCLHLATILGELMDEVVIVGGLVPSLLIDQNALHPEVDAHVGTLDLDLGLSLALSSEKQTRAVAQSLLNAGFEADLRQENRARQMWKSKENNSLTVDLLIPHTWGDTDAREVRDLKDLSAFVTPGLQLAFEDQELVALKGKTILGKPASATLRVCGPGAFVVLKAQAMRRRADNKDAYDLYYMFRNYGSGFEDVAKRYVPLMGDPIAIEALQYIREDFASWNAIGAERVAIFLSHGIEDDVRGEAYVLAKNFLSAVERLKESDQ